MMAPAVMAGLIPRPPPTAIRAIPTVPAVDQELPVATEVMQHTTQLATRNTAGLISFRPQ